MELNQLRYLVKLSETENFSRAAEELYITQPTLSQQIGRLEQELGVKLFERSTRSVKLTEIGALCAGYARNVLENIEEMEAVARQHKRNEASELLVGMLTVLPQLDITGVIARFQEENPGVDIKLVFGWSTELFQALFQKKLDVIISNVNFMEMKKKDERLNISPFLEDHMVVVVSRKSDYAKKEHIELKDFIGEKFWVVDLISSVKLEIEQRIRMEGMPLPEFLKCSSMASVMRMVASNLGVSVMSSGVAKEYAIADVTCIPIQPEIRTCTAIVTLNGGKASSLIMRFREYFLHTIREGRSEL